MKVLHDFCRNQFRYEKYFPIHFALVLKAHRKVMTQDVLLQRRKAVLRLLLLLQILSTFVRRFSLAKFISIIYAFVEKTRIDCYIIFRVRSLAKTFTEMVSQILLKSLKNAMQLVSSYRYDVNTVALAQVIFISFYQFLFFYSTKLAFCTLMLRLHS